MSYDDKLKKFDEVLHTEMEDDNWKPIYFELPFEFVWRDKYIVSGFIDRVDEKDGEYRVVDYKSSKKVFDSKKLPTAQQMCIYGVAILNMFGKLPKEYKYRFTLINEEQYALTKNWETRLIKKLDKIFDSIAESDNSEIYKPSPSPLCYYCPYCINNPNAKEYSRECEYYSLWKPDNKTFEVNRQFNVDDLKNNVNYTKLNSKERKLIF
jgi:RecB family exonuclease